MTVNVMRAGDIRAAVRLEIVTVIWMVLEGAVALGSGIIARSFLLTAFGIDSLIELASGSILLWRLAVESRGGDVEQVEAAEHRATWFVAFTFGCSACMCSGPLSTGWPYNRSRRDRPSGSSSLLLPLS
jgi:hypothetical protein